MATITENKNMFREIGRGCCGSIWALEHADWVVKRQHNNVVDRSVLNDQVMHRQVIAADTSYTLPVRIPCSYEVFEADDRWWDTNLKCFSGLDACRIYEQERIPAVSQPIRELLIVIYCPEPLRNAIRTSKKDEDCLIRLYTGKRRPEGRPPSRFFSLRNYGLCVDQMKELGLDYVAIAEALAEALAHCYWKAQVDANDVEFVLAPTATSDAAQNRIGGCLPLPVFRLLGQELIIWMLDYDCVHTMSQDIEGIIKAAHAFWRNDPYFPRPYAYGQTSHETELWQVFKAHFLYVSRCMIMEKEHEGVNKEMLELPQKWVTLIEAEGTMRAQREERRHGESV